MKSGARGVTQRDRDADDGARRGEARPGRRDDAVRSSMITPPESRAAPPNRQTDVSPHLATGRRKTFRQPPDRIDAFASAEFQTINMR